MPHPVEILGFAKELLVKQKCPYCQAKFSASDVTAQGNRLGQDGKSYYYYECTCNKCHQPSMTIITSRQMNTKGLMTALMEHYGKTDTDNDDPDFVGEVVGDQASPPPKEQSKITDAEVEKIKEMLGTAITHLDVLKLLGISSESLKRYLEEGEARDAADNEGK